MHADPLSEFPLVDARGADQDSRNAALEGDNFNGAKALPNPGVAQPLTSAV
jgi:hypothetical protein